MGLSPGSYKVTAHHSRWDRLAISRTGRQIILRALRPAAEGVRPGPGWPIWIIAVPMMENVTLTQTRASKASGSQQFDGGTYDHRAGSDFDGSERAPHQAYSGGLQKGWRSRNRSRQSRSQTWQRYTGDAWLPMWWSWRGHDTRESTIRT